MFADGAGDFEELLLSYNQSLMLVLSTLAYQAGVGVPGRSPRMEWPPSFGLPAVCNSLVNTILRSHVCQEHLKTFLSGKPDPIRDMLPRRLQTAVRAYLTCATYSQEGDVMERSIDLLLSCAACMSQLCMDTAYESEDPADDLRHKTHVSPELYNLPFMSNFEAVLFRAAKTRLPGFYSEIVGPAEFPCVNFGLCHCLMRPLYVAIYLSNVKMLSTLLRYGAEVRPEDSCRCDEPVRMHPLLRVYRLLTGIYWPGTGSIYTYGNGKISEKFVRCQQLAALVMPRQDAELRETCFTLTKAYTPPAEFEVLLTEKGSLQHFCRMAIRAALARRRAMPKGVEELPLPKLLQRYILYQYGIGSV